MLERLKFIFIRKLSVSKLKPNKFVIIVWNTFQKLSKSFRFKIALRLQMQPLSMMAAEHFMGKFS